MEAGALRDCHATCYAFGCQPAAPVQEEPSEEKMAKAVDRLARQTVAGLGGIAMKTCLAYIKNALEKPQVYKTEINDGFFVSFFLCFLF